jgi:hypothetical protein
MIFRKLLPNTLALFLPILLQGGGGWTLDEGVLRVKTYFAGMRTNERFASANLICDGRVCRNGERAPFFFEGRYTSYATFLGGRYGITDRIEVSALLPYYYVRYTDLVDPDRPPTTDIGDVLINARYQLKEGSLSGSVKAQVKAPTGFFNKDAEVVPVGDGQWDLTLSGQAGLSLDPWPAYLTLDLGYKFRFDPPRGLTDRAPGDEFVFRFEGGYEAAEGLYLKASINGLLGQEWQRLRRGRDLRIEDSERRILYTEPGIYWETGDWAFEGSVRFPLGGKNYPAGRVYGAGVMYHFGREG